MFKDQAHLLNDIIAFSKRRGLVYQTSEIYGGLTSSYDYGPLGVAILRNIKNQWWSFFIDYQPEVLGLDSQILLHPKTWHASGHVTNFNDPLVEDLVTKKRYRADHLIENWLHSHPEHSQKINTNDLNVEEMNVFIQNNRILSPDNNPLSKVKTFNLLFETSIGSTEENKNQLYLRGETAQGIFTNFINIWKTYRLKLPFGIGQIGKSFRNEITTGQFIFRTLEFEQAEIEYFFDPNENDWQELMNHWKKLIWQFVTEVLQIKTDRLRWRRHQDSERSFYSLDTYDLEYHFPFGWSEIWGLAYRTNYDLNQHQIFSKQNLEITNGHGESLLPHVIEPAVGVNRLFLMTIFDGLYFDIERKRKVLKLPHYLSPKQIAIFPLVKNKPELVNLAQKIYQLLQKQFIVDWDDRGNIGKRYLYQDEIGTPYCITIDYQSLEDQTITVRERDSSNQYRVPINQLINYLEEKLC